MPDANREFRRLVQNSAIKEKIIIANHNVHITSRNRRTVLRNDGVHFTDVLGKAIYTRSVKNVIMDCVDDMKSKHIYKENMHQNVSASIPTQNRFSLLGN